MSTPVTISYCRVTGSSGVSFPCDTDCNPICGPDIHYPRRFLLIRDEDVSGVSGTGVVADGVAFPDDGPVALRWRSEWPTSVVFHDRGVESLEAVHGHNGRTRIHWIDR